MANLQLSVRLQGKPVGILTQLPNAQMKFSYCSNASQFISIGMPLQVEEFSSDACAAFFGGLLPESEATRKAIAQQFKINFRNDFFLLKAIGYDCAGAISFHDINDPIQEKSTFTLTGVIVPEKDLYNHILELPKKPLFIGLAGLRLSLAGVHDKAAVCLIDKKIALPTQDCPTSHILKPPDRNFPGLVENEYICLQTAKDLGLLVPHNEISFIKDIPILLIERYDRQLQENQITRLHQEDFCQALGISSITKYQNEGGPALKASFDLLDKTDMPAIARTDLMKRVIFNYLTYNMDAHGKNFSILYLENKRLSLAPCYDLICTKVYPELAKKMAMKIGSQYQPEQVFPRHWQAFCENINYSYPVFKKMFTAMSEGILHSLDKNKNNYGEMTQNSKWVENIVVTISKHIEATLKKLE